MAEPVELWRQEKIESLAPGESWGAEEGFTVHRYKDGWHFYWKSISRTDMVYKDLGRFFDAGHLWEMRNFMGGQWDKGVRILPPPITDLL